MLHEFQASDVAVIMLLLVIIGCFVIIRYVPRDTSRPGDSTVPDDD